MNIYKIEITDTFGGEPNYSWASEAEFSFAEGNGASIELKARDSVHGRAQTFTISAAGVDLEETEN